MDMDIDLTPAFPTLIGTSRVPGADALNASLQALILEHESEKRGARLGGAGGWHSCTDFLLRPEPAVNTLAMWITWAVRYMVDATAGLGAFTGEISLSGWATVCRPGGYQAPHTHPDSAWSGVYFVDPGMDTLDGPLSGVLEFLDPRGGVEAVTAPGEPYGARFRIRPEAGMLVLFPSWLYHWVHPYTGLTPRIAVSFNATAERRASTGAPGPELAADVNQTHAHPGFNPGR